MRAFVVAVSHDEVELASDRLWAMGVRAIEERRRPAAGGGLVELWTMVGDDPVAIESAAAAMDPSWPWRVVEVDPVPADTWRHFVQPVVIRDRIVVAPAWTEVGAAGGLAAQDDRLLIRIEPGAAFGLGDHPTTQLSLGMVADELDRIVGRGGSPRSVLDVGCGSGVLGIAAARLGAVEVRCIDTSVAAVEATVANAARNAATGLVVDDTPLDQVDASFDVVVANILAPTLCVLADDLRRVTRPGGALIISGVLHGRHEHVVQALSPFVVEHTEALGGWAAVRLRHQIVDRSGRGE